MKIWDVSVPIKPGMPVWHQDPAVTLYRISDKDQGDEVNVSKLSCCVHTGTHVDAPLHFLSHGSAVEHMSLNVLIGQALVVEILNAATITPTHLEELQLPKGTTRILFKTRNSALWNNPLHPFFPDFVALTSDAATWLVNHGIQLVGIDYLSIQLFHDKEPDTHCRLLEAGIVIVEGLDLRDVPPGSYHLVCLPLKLVGSDGAPARVVLIEGDSVSAG